MGRFKNNSRKVSNGKGNNASENSIKIPTKVYDKFKTVIPLRLRKYLLNDLHAYTKYIAFPKISDVAKIIRDIKDMDYDDSNIFLSTRGLEWFHVICLDMIRYVCRNANEIVSQIPLYSPLRTAILMAEETGIPHIAYWKTAQDYNTPRILEMMPEDVNDPNSRYIVPPDADMPKMDGYEDVAGLSIIVDPRCKLMFFGLPRGRLKSSIMAAVHAWYAERNPEKSQFLASWNQTKIHDHMKDIRYILEKDLGRRVFADKHPAKKNENAKWTNEDLTLVGDHLSPIGGEQIVGRSPFKSPEGTHPSLIAWDDVEVEASKAGEHTQRLHQRFNEQYANLLNPGGAMIVTGTLYAEDGVHIKLIQRKIVPAVNVICASWHDGSEENDGYGKSISRKWSDEHMLKLLHSIPADEFARNHELRNIAKEDVMFHPLRLFNTIKYAEWSNSVKKTPFDRVVIVTDTTRSDGTGDKADYMSGVALGKISSTKQDESDKIYLLGIYHTKPKTNRKGTIYGAFISRILTTIGRKYGFKNLDESFVGTEDHNIADYIESDAESDMSIQHYRQIAKTYVDGNDTSDDIGIELAKTEEYLYYRIGNIENHYVPKLLKVSTKGRKKVDRLNQLCETLKALAATNSFIVPEEYYFWYAPIAKNHGKNVNQMDELRREMLNYTPGSRTKHDDMLDSLAHAIELLHPNIYYNPTILGNQTENKLNIDNTPLHRLSDKPKVPENNVWQTTTQENIRRNSGNIFDNNYF